MGSLTEWESEQERNKNEALGSVWWIQGLSSVDRLIKPIHTKLSSLVLTCTPHYRQPLSFDHMHLQHICHVHNLQCQSITPPIMMHAIFRMPIMSNKIPHIHRPYIIIHSRCKTDTTQKCKLEIFTTVDTILCLNVLRSSRFTDLVSIALYEHDEVWWYSCALELRILLVIFSFTALFA